MTALWESGLLFVWRYWVKSPQNKDHLQKNSTTSVYFGLASLCWGVNLSFMDLLSTMRQNDRLIVPDFNRAKNKQSPWYVLCATNYNGSRQTHIILLISSRCNQLKWYEWGCRATCRWSMMPTESMCFLFYVMDGLDWMDEWMNGCCRLKYDTPYLKYYMVVDIQSSQYWLEYRNHSR